MSTRSCIVIKVKESDLNQVKKFNPELLPVKVEGWDCYGESTSDEKSQPVELKGAYIGIYCHSDGYPSGVGAVLKEKFNDYETALNLIIVWFGKTLRHSFKRGLGVHFPTARRQTRTSLQAVWRYGILLPL